MITSTATVDVAESWAVKLGVNLCRSLCLHNICIASDAASVVKMLKSPQSASHDLSVVYDNVLAICNALMNVVFDFCPHTTNEVAHSLAKLVFSLENERLWSPGGPTRV